VQKRIEIALTRVERALKFAEWIEDEYSLYLYKPLLLRALVEARSYLKVRK